MPVVQLHSIHPQSIWGIWEIVENSQDLSQLLEGNLNLPSTVATMPEHKKQQSLAARLLTKALLQTWELPYEGIQKDDCGKPYLPASPLGLSFSHTSKYAVALLHQQQAVGIDIEQKREKLFRVAPRIFSPEEQEFCADDLDKLTIYWTAKEALYKLYGKKQLVFQRDMQILPFDLKNEGFLQALLLNQRYDLYYQKYKDFYICYVIGSGGISS